MHLDIFIYGVLVVVSMATGALSVVRTDPRLLRFLDDKTGGDNDSVTSQVEVASRVLKGVGLHHTLVTELLPLARDGSPLRAIVVERVTRDMYVDLDEVSNLGEFGGVQVVASGHIDTEKPAAVSMEHVVLVYSLLENGRARVELPLHFRYQAPSNARHHTVAIPPPIAVLLEAPANTDSEKDGDLIFQSLPCNVTSADVCLWRAHLVKPISQVSGSSLQPLRVDIPCGQTGDSAMVVAGTMLATLAGMAYLLHTIATVRM